MAAKMSSSCDSDNELDPRIQIELEKLNATTIEINKLEVDFDEANLTFRMLLNESTRRLKLLSKRLGNCIEKARPYFIGVAVAKRAQQECQKAAVAFQRANEIHTAAKETVTLAEERFISNQHEWEFDNAWQEMLNHATMKVMEADGRCADTRREHQQRATTFKTAEQQVKQLLSKQHKNILKAQPYFDEKQLCQDQLDMQKERIEALRQHMNTTKTHYAETLKNLEAISNEIHLRRHRRSNSEGGPVPQGPREPGVGAELTSENHLMLMRKPICTTSTNRNTADYLNYELESRLSSLTLSEAGDTNEGNDDNDDDDDDSNVRPLDGGGEGKSMDGVWVNEATTDKNGETGAKT